MTEICLVCVPYTAPSSRHVPWLLRVSGEPALGVLLRRLHGCCPTVRERCVVSADSHRFGDVQRIARARDWRLFADRSGQLMAALAAFADTQPDEPDILLFPANALVPQADACARLLERHRDAAADATVAVDPLLDGLVPVVVRSSALRTLADRFPEILDVTALAGALRSSPAPAGLRVARPPSQSVFPDVDDRTLPAIPVVENCWSQRAASAADAAPTCEAARVFKQRMVAARDEIVPIPPRAAAINGARTVVFSSMRKEYTGAEASLFALITGLDRRRYVPVALLPYESLLAERLRRAGVDTLVAGWDYSVITPRNLRFAEKVLEVYRPDILHVDLMASPTLMLAARTRAVPIVGHLRVPPKNTVGPYVFMPERIIAVSDTVARRLQRFDIDPERVVTIYNAVSESRTTGTDRVRWRETLGIPPDAFVVAAVARVTPDKKLDVFLAAIARALPVVPSIWALIVGEPMSVDLAHARALRVQATADGVAARTTWVPFEEDIEKIFEVTDVLALCSTHEAFPRSVLEAMAAGVPVIVPDAGGSTEMVVGGDSGLIVEPDSPGALASAILTLTHDHELRHRLQSGGRRRARDFSRAHQVGIVHALYDELCCARLVSPGRAQ